MPRNKGNMGNNGGTSAKRLTEICREYNVPVDIAESKIIKKGVSGFFNRDIPMFETTLDECTEIVKSLANPKPQPRQQSQPKPQSRQQLQPRPTEYLLRDYIVLTLSSVRKKGFSKLIDDFLRKRRQYNAESKVVMLWESLRVIAPRVRKGSYIETNLEYITNLYKNGFSILLEGSLNKEKDILEEFIRKEYFNGKSIIVFGDSYGLSQAINYLNTSRRNTNYITIYERDFLEDGKIINPSLNHVFNEISSQKLIQSRQIRGNISLPSGGDIVYTSNGNAVKLKDIISDGGKEGIIYQTSESGKYAKIFKSGDYAAEKYEKVRKMCLYYRNMKDNNPILIEKISWPEKRLFNENKEFVGYLMRKFENENIIPFLNLNSGNIRKYIPGIKKEHQIKMAKNLSELIVFLHKNNVILCDINKGNILFNIRTLEAYIVDIDSAQIADENYIYGCNVGRQEFLSPENIYRNNFSFIHKKADDVWALQMLLFNILTPFGNAYLTAVDEEESVIIETGQYPFQAGDNPSQNVAGGKNGMWHIIVSHFPKYLKEYFWNSFHNKGKNFHESDRMTARDWFNIMLRYEHDLSFMIKKDINSGEYEPTEPKRATDDNLFEM